MYLRHNYKVREPQTIPGQFDLEFYKQYNGEEVENFKINNYISINKPDYYRNVYNDEPFLNCITYNKPSRYSKVPTIKILGKCYHTTNRNRFVNYYENDKYYIVTNQTKNRLDIISNQFYGTPIYWWLIAEANYIFDPLNEVYVDRKLRIPSIDGLNKYSR